MDYIKVQKSSDKFYCENCDYSTSRQSQYERHILSYKHKKITQDDETSYTKVPKSSENYYCHCGKEYKYRQGLWKHRKTCKTDDCASPETEAMNTVIYNQPTDKHLIMMLIKENSELKTMMMEQQNMMMKVIENGTHTNNTINNNNSHNKAFNLNFFLNETCKDAMNIMDFVESIKLQVSDLESVGELGYIEGISNIIVKNLNALDVTQRPVHCTDKKRETIYIKDDNKWEKDEEQKKMHKMIKKVADKNARLLPKFTEKYPDYKNYHSKTSDIYSKIIIEAMGGSGDNDYEKEEKIIKKIAREILVEK
jgi:hypothetical protein